MKKFLTLILFSLACAMCMAQAYTQYDKLLLTIDKADGQYAAGETVEVYATASEGVASSFTLKVTANGKTIEEKKGLSFTPGKKEKVYSCTYNEPTSVMVYATPDGEEKLISSVGFIFNAYNSCPGFDAPKDLKKFWKKQVSELRKCFMEGKLTAVPSKKQGILSYSMEVNMPEGRPVHAYLSMPENAAKKSLPIVISLHGAGYTQSTLSTSVYWASKGAIGIDMNAHGFLDGQPKEYYDAFANGELKDYRHRKVVDHESFYFRLMFLRIQRALDFATKLKEWDGKNILARGASQGGLQTIAITAIDPRVNLAAIEVPAMTDLAGTQQGHRGSWPGYYKDIDASEEGSPERTILPYYDGAVLIQMIDKATIWVEAGLVDTTCPPECVFAAFNSAPTKNKTIFTNPYRQHSTKTMTPEMKKDWSKNIDKVRMDSIMDSFEQ